MRYLSALSALFFKSFNTMRQLEDLIDYPLPEFEDMPRVTGCSKARLLETTFFHLGKKFGRSIQSLRIDHFLSGSVADHLRYCPACLARSSYYRLPWRFETLLGCSIHKCRLLEHCSHCGSKLPLFASPLKINICSTCNGDLRACRAESLLKEELRIARSHLRDLEFLLSPHACENDEALIKSVGRQIFSRRHPRIITAKRIARHTGIKLSQIGAVDRGIVKGRGAKFQTYIKYADFVGTTMRQIFCVEGTLRGRTTDSF